MRARVVLAVLAVLAFLVIPTTRGEAQQRAAPPATDVTAAEIEAVYNTIGSSIDQQIKVGDVGHGYVGVGVLHRDAIEDQGDTPSGLVHTEVSEIYYMLSGSGTLVTGGTTTVLNYIPANSRVVIELIGPSYQATSRGGYARQISEGDVVVIPAGLFHAWSEVPDHVTYLSMRLDPDGTLPLGYIHPVLESNED